MAVGSDNVFPKVILAEGAAPATPAATQVKLYAKADGLLYSKDDTDRYYPAGAGPYIGDGAYFSQTDSTQKFSIRALVL